MATKSKMSCNKVMRSDRAGKKKMVKGCEGVNLLRRGTSVALLSLSLQLGTGRAKNFGQARVVLLSRALKPKEENISIFVEIFYYAYSKL